MLLLLDCIFDNLGNFISTFIFLATSLTCSKISLKCFSAFNLSSSSLCLVFYANDIASLRSILDVCRIFDNIKPSANTLFRTNKQTINFKFNIEILRCLAISDVSLSFHSEISSNATSTYSKSSKKS